MKHLEETELSESYTYRNNWGWEVAYLERCRDKHLIENYGLEWELVNPFTGEISYVPNLWFGQVLAEGLSHIYRSYAIPLLNPEEPPRSTRGGIWRSGRMAGLPVAYDAEGNAGVNLFEQFAPATDSWWS